MDTVEGLRANGRRLDELLDKYLTQQRGVGHAATKTDSARNEIVKCVFVDCTTSWWWWWPHGLLATQCALIYLTFFSCHHLSSLCLCVSVCLLILLLFLSVNVCLLCSRRVSAWRITPWRRSYSRLAILTTSPSLGPTKVTKLQYSRSALCLVKTVLCSWSACCCPQSGVCRTNCQRRPPYGTTITRFNTKLFLAVVINLTSWFPLYVTTIVVFKVNDPISMINKGLDILRAWLVVTSTAIVVWPSASLAASLSCRAENGQPVDW